MRTSKIITLILIFVSFSFLHVFLQTEIIKLGYEVKKNEDRLQEFVEDNYVLKYNICALESPRRLDRYIVEKNSNLKTLEPFQILRLYSKPNPIYGEAEKNVDSLFNRPAFLALRKFFIGRQAEAKTIK